MTEKELQKFVKKNKLNKVEVMKPKEVEPEEFEDIVVEIVVEEGESNE